MTPRVSRLTSLVLTALVVGVACAEAQTVAGRPSNQPTATGTKWVVDPVHSQINFRVRHLVGRVQGTFVDWYGIIVTTDQDWTHGTVKVTAQTLPASRRVTPTGTPTCGPAGSSRLTASLSSRLRAPGSWQPTARSRSEGL
jgi:YceI-like protein